MPSPIVGAGGAGEAARNPCGSCTVLKVVACWMMGSADAVSASRCGVDATDGLGQARDLGDGQGKFEQRGSDRLVALFRRERDDSIDFGLNRGGDVVARAAGRSGRGLGAGRVHSVAELLPPSDDPPQAASAARNGTTTSATEHRRTPRLEIPTHETVTQQGPARMRPRSNVTYVTSRRG